LIFFASDKLSLVNKVSDAHCSDQERNSSEF
jgi:hypothetical protein